MMMTQILSFVADTLGTLSMLPREHNGVVNPRLLVYGTKNIRVADLSIVPLQLAAHTQGKDHCRKLHSHISFTFIKLSLLQSGKWQQIY